MHGHRASLGLFGTGLKFYLLHSPWAFCSPSAAQVQRKTPHWRIFSVPKRQKEDLGSSHCIGPWGGHDFSVSPSTASPGFGEMEKGS